METTEGHRPAAAGDLAHDLHDEETAPSLARVPGLHDAGQDPAHLAVLDHLAVLGHLVAAAPETNLVTNLGTNPVINLVTGRMIKHVKSLGRKVEVGDRPNQRVARNPEIAAPGGAGLERTGVSLVKNHVTNQPRGQKKGGNQ